MESSELSEYFNEFIDEYFDKPKNLQTLKQLYELAYRQWDTYEALDENIEKKLEDYLMSALDFKSLELVDTILSIVENLSMKNVFQYIVGQKDNVKIFAIKELIEEAEEEYSDSIDDPYSDLDDW